MTDLKLMLEQAVADVGPARDVEADVARGRRALRRLRAAQAVFGAVLVASLAVAVPQLMPSPGGGGPAGSGPTATLSDRRPATELYPDVNAALADQRLIPAEPLRWRSVPGPVFAPVGGGGGDLPAADGALPGRGLMTTGTLPGGAQLTISVYRLDAAPSRQLDYCVYFWSQPGCEQIERDGNLVVRYSEIARSGPASAGSIVGSYQDVTVLTDDRRAVRLAMSDGDVPLEQLTDLATDPRLRW